MEQWYNELTSLSHTTVVNEREDFVGAVRKIFLEILHFSIEKSDGA